MTQPTIVFEPTGFSLQVLRGKSIHEAAMAAGISLGGECGGSGRCGKCKVVLLTTESVSAASEVERSLLSDEELAAGVRLACQARILGDLTVTVPSSVTRGLRRVQIEVEDRDIPLDPMIRKLAVHIPAPSLLDVRSDLERLASALDVVSSVLNPDIDLLRRLPTVLRDSSWHVTAVLWKEQRLLDLEPGTTIDKCYGLAVDIGTSKVAVQLVDLNTGRAIATRGSENPQLSYGEDLIDRIKTSEENGKLEVLQKTVVKEIGKLLAEMTEESGVSQQEIYEAVVVGNSVMNHIFLGVPPRFISYSPFTPVFTSPYDSKAAAVGLGINSGGMVHIPPNIAGFVGSDALADIIAAGILESDRTTFLIDIGTNTEVFLGNREGVSACSCASGPAFEGAHIRHGMKAVVGAIERVRLDQDATSLDYDTIGEVAAKGLCGSAVVDLVAELYLKGILTDRGRFDRNFHDERLRAEEGLPEFVVAWGQETETGRDIVLTQKDVNEILLAKAAIFAGCSVLMKRMGVNQSDIEEIVVGGAFGCYINPENAIAIGMLPDIDPHRVSLRDNLALFGAKMLLVSREHRNLEEHVRSRVEYVELTVDPSFKTEFTDALFLPNRDVSRFPTASRLLKNQ